MKLRTPNPAEVFMAFPLPPAMLDSSDPVIVLFSPLNIPAVFALSITLLLPPTTEDLSESPNISFPKVAAPPPPPIKLWAPVILHQILQQEQSRWYHHHQ
jgi:hypothetical protein